MRTLDIQLGDKTYTLRQLTVRPSRKWRQQVDEKYRDAIEAFVNVIVSWPENDGPQGTNALGHLFTQHSERILPVIQKVLLESIDDAFELLLDYSPELQKDREYLEENAYDDEIIKAFLEVLQWAYPFASLFRQSMIQDGQQNGR